MVTVASAHPITARRAIRIWRVRRRIRALIMVIGLTIFSIWTLFPFLWIVETSIKPTIDIYQDASFWPKHITGAQYGFVLHQTSFFTYFRNSVVVAVGTTCLAMLIGILSAYAITRLSFRGRTIMARVTIFTYLVPSALLFIPILELAYRLHLTNKASGLIVIYLIFTVPFCTWLAISYFNTIPAELEDAALVDGANRLQSLLHIVVPLALPALAVIALFAFTESWNEFLFALLLIGSDSQKTIPLGLSSFINGDVFQWGALMAMSLLASLPPILIYILAQKWVVSGLSGGAIRG